MLNRPFARYLIAAAAVAVALALRHALVSALHAELPAYITFYPAVMLAAVVGGFGPGLAATALSALAVDYFVLPPTGSFAIETPADVTGLALFCLMGIFMSVVAERYRRNRERAADAEKELALQVGKAALAESEQRWATTLRSIGDAVIAVDAMANITFMNEMAQFMTGWSEAEARGRPANEIFRLAHEHTGEPIESPISLAMRLSQVVEVANQAVVVARGGSRIPVEDSAAPIRDESGNLTGVVLVFRDVTERRARRREREQMLQAAQRQAELQRISFDAIVVWRLGAPGEPASGSPGQGIESWNQGAEQLYGYSESEALGRVTHDLLKSVHTKPWPELEPELRANGFWEGEIHHRTKDGRERIVWARKRLLRGDDGVERVLEANRDITDRKRAENERETTIEFLRLVNQSQGTRDLIQRATTFFQRRSDCEAVGIRLQEGNDYPYFEYRGFSKEFVQAENHLCRCDENGLPILDNAGHPALDCMCGNVIHGRFDPSKPFFTANGSFWANDTTRLLAITTDADRQARTRNRCNGEGYESVALIPLCAGQQRLGLLQLNDRRKGMFSTEIIALWERLAGYLAAGLSTFRAEEALRESEQQFRELAEGIPQLAWTANPDGWIYWYNRRWYEYTGTTPKQMEGWGWQSVHDPNELPKVMERWKSSIATGEPFEMVFPLLGADGVFRPFLTRVMPLRDAQGRVVRWFGTNTDISEQRKMEEALRQSLERLERVLEVETVGVMFWDLNTGIMVDANDAFLKLMGYSRSDVEERKLNWQNLTPPEYLDVSRAEVEKFLATGRVGPYEKEYFRKDGTKQWLLFAGSSLGNNQCVEFCVDISDRKKAEAALRQSEQRWATTLRSIGDAVISTCAQGKIMFMNDVAQALTGWTLAEAQGQALETVFNIINEVTREKTENPLSKVLRLGQIVGLANHTALVSRDGTEYPIEDSAAPIRSQDGTTTGIVLVFHDVTEKRKAEQVLRQSERLATTGRLAATLAHEIHNPLDTVGNLLYLIDQVPDLGTARQYAAMASDEVVRVTQMTRHMLAFQRESSKPLPVDIAEILDGAVALFDRKIASSNLQIEKQVDFDHEFLGLTSEIRQVLVNLFGNAVEAVGQHGKIRLRARASCNWHDGQRGLRVTVADNGPGIAANVRAKIFEPFFTTKGEAGTGLGLWITSGIVEKYGGTLRLRSVTRPGRSGTSFSVFLPIER